MGGDAVDNDVDVFAGSVLGFFAVASALEFKHSLGDHFMATLEEPRAINWAKHFSRAGRVGMYGASIGAVLAGTALGLKYWRQKDDFLNYGAGGFVAGAYMSVGQKSFSRASSAAVGYGLLFGFFGHAAKSIQLYLEGEENVPDRVEKRSVVGTNELMQIVNGELRKIEQEE